MIHERNTCLHWYSSRYGLAALCELFAFALFRDFCHGRCLTAPLTKKRPRRIQTSRQSTYRRWRIAWQQADGWKVRVIRDGDVRGDVAFDSRLWAARRTRLWLLIIHERWQASLTRTNICSPKTLLFQATATLRCSWAYTKAIFHWHPCCKICCGVC